MAEQMFNMNELEKSKKQLLTCVALIIILVFSVILYRVCTVKVEEYHNLAMAVFFIRVVNIILLFLASASCLNSYERLKDDSVFVISIVYIGLAVGALFNQVDYLTLSSGTYGIKGYIVMAPSILRLVLLLISINPKNKLNKIITTYKIKSILFIVLFTIIVGTFEIHQDFYFKSSHNFMIFYLLSISIAYTIASTTLFGRGIKEKEYLFIILSISVFIIGMKSAYIVFTMSHMTFYMRLISIGLSYVLSLIVIGGSFIELYIYINKSRILNNNLRIFHSIVDNDRHSFEFIFSEDAEMLYCNKKVKEYFNGMDTNDNKLLASIIDNISSEFKSCEESTERFRQTGGWRGIIKDDFNEMMLDCSVQLIGIEDRKDITISFIDISEEIKTELELEKLKSDTNERTEFMSNISHELRTPVNIFYSTIQLLDHKCTSKNEEFKLMYEKYKRTLHINCKRMLRLINNVIDVSKIDIGNLDSRFGNYNIVCVVEDVTLSVINYAKLKNISIEFDTNEEEKIIKCDPNLIERVILNLLSNAIKFSPENSNIYVEMIINEDFTEINVRDEGIGISEKNKKVIFERFIRADKTLARENEGSGIGLSIVKSIIDLHEGYISIDSELGKGSTFKIILPNELNENEECSIYDIDNYSIEMELSDIYEVLEAQ